MLCQRELVTPEPFGVGGTRRNSFHFDPIEMGFYSRHGFQHLELSNIPPPTGAGVVDRRLPSLHPCSTTHGCPICHIGRWDAKQGRRTPDFRPPVSHVQKAARLPLLTSWHSPHRFGRMGSCAMMSPCIQPADFSRQTILLLQPTPKEEGSTARAG